MTATAMALSLAMLSTGSTADVTDPPRLPEWPGGVARPEFVGGKVCLTPLAADAVAYRLAACEALESRCAVTVEGLAGVERETRERCPIVPPSVTTGRGVPAWAIAIMFVAGLIAGLAISR